MKNLLTILFLFIFLFPTVAQQADVIYDEAKVPPYTLPPLLISENGTKITSSHEWETIRKPELLKMFAAQMFGQTPEMKVKVTYETVKINKQALDGKATCKQVKVTFSNGTVERQMLLLIYLPNSVKGKAPLFVGCNFGGNQTVADDPEIISSSNAGRGSAKLNWQVEKIISAGYGLATFWNSDLFPDAKDGHDKSILPLFGYKAGGPLGDSDWQAMGAWAWGLSRAMDYFETDEAIDASKVILMGHSRNGKAALWAGVQDERFAVMVSNDSGCGGAALSKRIYGETVGTITNAFPYWFCKGFSRYAGKEAELPFDQHEFLALIAPRPLYVASAEDDRWADPKGEYLSAYYAGEVYKLYGLQGLTSPDLPEVNHPVMNRVAYHVRTGGHNVTDFDWEQYIKFADKWLK